MIEHITEFEQDRVSLWMKVDDTFKDLQPKVAVYPEFKIVFNDLDQVKRVLKINPHFLYGLWLIRRGLEQDIMENIPVKVAA